MEGNKVLSLGGDHSITYPILRGYASKHGKINVLQLDVLDPAFAPGVSHYEPGGLSVREILTVIHDLEVPVIGADIVELNPTRDIQEMTAMVAAKFMKELLAEML